MYALERYRPTFTNTNAGVDGVDGSVEQGNTHATRPLLGASGDALGGSGGGVELQQLSENQQAHSASDDAAEGSSQTHESKGSQSGSDRDKDTVRRTGIRNAQGNKMQRSNSRDSSLLEWDHLGNEEMCTIL